jgi:thiol-disulfide isomerase/thioredoxin
MRKFVALAFVCVAVLAARPAVADVAVGQPAPQLVAKEVNGPSFDLGAQRGKVVIVNFWATWCVPCRQEMPAIDAFYHAHRNEGVEVIGLSVDRSRDRGNVQKVMKAFTYPAAMESDATVNGFGKPHVLPVTYVVDASGVVRAALRPDEDPVTESSLSKVVLPLLHAHPAQ